MKRYLKIMGEVLWQTDEITREDLAGIKQRKYDAIVCVPNGEYFDVNENTWKKIPG